MLDRANVAGRAVVFEEVELAATNAWRELSFRTGAVGGRIAIASFDEGQFVLTSTEGGRTVARLLAVGRDGTYSAPGMPVGEVQMRYARLPLEDTDPRKWAVVGTSRIEAGGASRMDVDGR